MYFRNTLEGLRRKFDLTYNELSELTCIAASYLKYLEDGSRGLPKDEYIHKLGEAFTRTDKDSGLNFNIDYTEVLFRVVQFEKTIVQNKAYIWRIIEQIVYRNYEDFSSSGQEGFDSEEVLKGLVALAGHKVMPQRDYKNIENRDYQIFKHKMNKIFITLKEKKDAQQIIALSHFIKSINFNCEDQELRLIFTNNWLQSKYDEMTNIIKENLLYEFIESCSYDNVLNK